MTQEKDGTQHKAEKNLYSFKSLGGIEDAPVPLDTHPEPKAPSVSADPEDTLPVQMFGAGPDIIDVQAAAQAFNTRVAQYHADIAALKAKAADDAERKLLNESLDRLAHLQEEFEKVRLLCKSEGIVALTTRNARPLHEAFTEYSEKLESLGHFLAEKRAAGMVMELTDRKDILDFVTGYYRKAPSAEVLADVSKITRTPIAVALTIGPLGGGGPVVECLRKESRIKTSAVGLSEETVRLMADMAVANGYTNVTLTGCREDRRKLEMELLCRNIKVNNPLLDAKQFDYKAVKAARDRNAERWTGVDDAVADKLLAALETKVITKVQERAQQQDAGAKTAPAAPGMAPG